MGFISEIKLEEFAHLRSLGSQEARLGKSRSTLRPQTTVIKDCHNSKKRLIYCADFQRNVLILSLSQTLLLSPESSDRASLASDTMNTRTQQFESVINKCYRKNISMSALYGWLYI